MTEWYQSTIVTALSLLLFTSMGCTPIPVQFSLIATVSGLQGELLLSNNGADSATILIDGSQELFSQLSTGYGFDIDVVTQPDGQHCFLENASGTVVEEDVTNIVISCLSDWVGPQQFGSPQGDMVVNLDLAKDQSIYAVGRSSDGFSYAAIWKRDASGAELWHQNAENRFLTAIYYDVVIDDDGFAYAVGRGSPYTFNNTSTFVMVTKFSPDGEQLWDIEFGGVGFDWASGIALGQDNKLYVSGTTTSSSFENLTVSGEKDVFVTQIDADTGERGWSRLFGNEAEQYNEGAIAVNNDNEIIIAYEDKSTSVSNVAVAAVNSHGELLFDTTLSNGGFQTNNQMDLDASGNIYLSGHTGVWDFDGNFIGDNDGVFVLKLSPTAEILWWDIFIISASYNLYAGVAVDHQGNITIGGDTSKNLPGEGYEGSTDGFAIHWNSAGERMWIQQFGGFQFDSVWGISTDNHGNIILGGITYFEIYGNSSVGDTDAFLVKLASDTGDVMMAP